jgi:putative protein-disulfide isomerase
LAVLHYIYDPFCGWCYGAAPLLNAAQIIEGVEIALHAGGMLTGARRQPVTPQFRAFVMQHDARIAQMSGQPFGTAYCEELLNDTGAVFDSEPPTTAILAAGARGLEMLKRIQKAHFEEGRRVAEEAVLSELAREMGIEGFSDAYEAMWGEPTARHMAESRQLLSQAGGHGFPTFLLQTGDSAIRLDHGPYLGRVRDWTEWLNTLLPGVARQ